MTQLKPYPKYKDSGVEWIGEIPEDWDVSKLKFLTSIITGNTPPKSNEGNYLNGTMPWVKPDNMNNDYSISDTKEKLSKEGIKHARIIPENSALVCCIGSVGKIAVNVEKVTTNQQINSIIFNRKNDLDSDFGLYSVISAKDEYIKQSNTVVVSILNKTAQENIKLPLPNIDIQKKISTFLKNKTKEIDNLISDKERLIKLLEEKRQAIITETVTKGLDPNVKMKDSGIEWIGEIPEHWETVKIKRYVKVMNGKEIENELSEDNDGIDVFGSGGVFKKTDKPLYEGESVLFGRKGTIGKPLYVNKPFWTVDTMYYTNFDEKSFPKWFYYMFLIFPWEEHTTQTAIPSIVGTDIENEPFAVPTYDEQKLIVTYLDEKMSSIDGVIEEIKQQIIKINKYRESLIYEAVTGKIDLRDIDINEREESVTEYEEVAEGNESYQ